MACKRPGIHTFAHFCTPLHCWILAILGDSWRFRPEYRGLLRKVAILAIKVTGRGILPGGGGVPWCTYPACVHPVPPYPGYTTMHTSTALTVTSCPAVCSVSGKGVLGSEVLLGLGRSFPRVTQPRVVTTSSRVITGLRRTAWRKNAEGLDRIG